MKITVILILDQGKIAEVFRDVFATAAQPNSNVTNDSLKSRFLDRYHNYIGDQITGEVFTVELVDKMIRGMKRGKAAAWMVSCQSICILAIP